MWCSSISKWILIFCVLGFLLVSIDPVSSQESLSGKWVLARTELNPNNRPLERPAPSIGDRFEGSFYKWTVSETRLSYNTRKVDRDKENWNVLFEANFDKPPVELIPGDIIELTAKITGSGKIEEGFPLMIFEYRGEGVGFKGKSSFQINEKMVGGTIKPSFEVPPTTRGELVIRAFLWNCAGCNVRWIYKASSDGEKELSEEDFEDVDAEPSIDTVWEQARKKCDDPNELKPEFTQEEFIAYLRAVEKENPGKDWRIIVAALHGNKYRDDVLGRRVPIFGIPLFLQGGETDGWEDIDLACYKGKISHLYNAPVFVSDSEGRRIDIGHAYAGLRSDLNRDNGVTSGIRSAIMRRVNTHWGDTWQWVIHNVIWREQADRAPQNQRYGNDIALWLSAYYNNPENQDVPLSEAFNTYFQSSGVKK